MKLYPVLIGLFTAALFGIAVGDSDLKVGPHDIGVSVQNEDKGQWELYDNRYAIVVMGGNEPSGGQRYRWYWNDTSGEVWTLIDRGFSPDNIIFLSYGDSAAVHPELVDGTCTKGKVQTAFEAVALTATSDDLVYVWWIDHGNTDGFEVHSGFVYFTELKMWIDQISCRAYIGAYNPCYSGAIMPHMNGLCNDQKRVISVSSVTATQENSYGWAGMWRKALRGAYPDDNAPYYSDKDMDGYINIDEAFEWEAPHSNEAGEYPLLDDNCDGSGASFPDTTNYDSSGTDSSRDGYLCQYYNLMAWYDRGAKYPADGLMKSNLSSVPSNKDRKEDSRTYGIEIDWSIGAPLPSPVCRGISGLIDGKIYLFGGHPCPVDVHYIYDIGADSWSTEAASMPIYGSNIRGVVRDNKLYALGGHIISSDTMRCYNPAGNSWEIFGSPYPTISRECCKYGAAAVGTKIYYYYMETRYNYYPIQEFWEYDAVTGNWNQKFSMPPYPKRMYTASASDGIYCYAIGGINHDAAFSVSSDMVRYNPVADNWETMDPLPNPLAYGDGDFLGDRLYIAGGGAGYSPWPATADVYSWKEGEGWVTVTPLPAPVGCPHVEVASINDTTYLFVFGGYNEGYLSTMYVGRVTGGCFCRPGDANGDGEVNVADAVYVINYVFKEGPPPAPYAVCSGDANCDCDCNVADAVYIINYVFKEGPPPCSCEDWETACGTP